MGRQNSSDTSRTLDTIDRTLDKLNKTIVDLPPVPIYWVLCKWQARIETIERQLMFSGVSTEDVLSPAARELMALKLAKIEIEAACAVGEDDDLRAFSILLEAL